MSTSPRSSARSSRSPSWPTRIESTAQVGDRISHVAAIGQENAAAAQEVAAASAETSASMEDVRRTAGDMGSATEERGRLIRRFRI